MIVKQTSRQAVLRLIPLLLAAATPLLCLQCSPHLSASLGCQQSMHLADLASVNLETGPIAPSGEPSGPVAGCSAHPHLLLARSNPTGLLEKALERWEPVDGYRVTFVTQERLNGVLNDPSVIEATVMRQPYAVSFRWVKNPGKVDRLLWMPSRCDKLVVHPTGLLSAMVKSITVDPSSDSVRRSSRRSVTSFGLSNTLRTLLVDFRRNQHNGTMRCRTVLASSDISAAPAICLERVTSDSSSESKTVRVWLDLETLRPLQVQQYGWSDELLASYAFEDFQTLQLSPDNFELAALDMR